MGGLVTSASSAPSHRRSGHRIPSGGPCSSRFIAGLSPAFPADSLCFMRRLWEDCRADMRPRHLSLTPSLIQETWWLALYHPVYHFILIFTRFRGRERLGRSFGSGVGLYLKSAAGTALGNTQRPWDPLVSPSILFKKFLSEYLCVC